MSGPYVGRSWRTGDELTHFSISTTPAGTKAAFEEELVVFRVPHSSMEDEIRRLAMDYCDYLNKLHAAKQEAVKNITISSAVAERMSK